MTQDAQDQTSLLDFATTLAEESGEDALPLATRAKCLESLSHLPTRVLLDIRSLSTEVLGARGLAGGLLADPQRLVSRERIGAGAFGEVYSAFDEALGRQVAIKFPRVRLEREDLPSLFAAEARAQAKLSHQNIAAIYAFGFETNGQPFLVQEFVDAKPVRELIAAGESARWWAPLLRGSAEGLQYSHMQGVVHRDLKPENMLWSPGFMGMAGNPLKLIDFGLAKVVEPLDEAQSDVSSGTPLYMAPEMLARRARGTGYVPPVFKDVPEAVWHQVDHRVDVFSWGVLAFEILTGSRPFQASEQILIGGESDRLESSLGGASGIPVEVTTQVLRHLSADPRKRPTFRETVEVLEKLARERAEEAMRTVNIAFGPGPFSTGRVSRSGAPQPSPMEELPPEPAPDPDWEEVRIAELPEESSEERGLERLEEARVYMKYGLLAKAQRELLGYLHEGGVKDGAWRELWDQLGEKSRNKQLAGKTEHSLGSQDQVK